MYAYVNYCITSKVYFGICGCMHAKAEQVQEFIARDLLKIVEDAFGQADETRKEELQAKKAFGFVSGNS